MCVCMSIDFLWINSSNLGWAQNHLPTHLSSTLKHKMFKQLIWCVCGSPGPDPPTSPHACMHACMNACMQVRTFTSPLDKMKYRLNDACRLLRARPLAARLSIHRTHGGEICGMCRHPTPRDLCGQRTLGPLRKPRGFCPTLPPVNLSRA